MSKTIDTIIFDLDGVLVDSQPAVLRATVETLARYGIDVTNEEVRENIGGGTTKYMWLFLNRSLGKEQAGQCIDEAAESKNNLQSVYTENVILLPQAEELLIRLKGCGYRLALATMSARRVVD